MLYLGSKSPRRQELLGSIISDFRIIHRDVDESFDEVKGMNMVAGFLAEKKFKAMIGELDVKDYLITADTVVIKDNIIYNKPSNKEEAAVMLNQLCGGFHEVMTGVAFGNKKRHHSFTETTRVYMDEMTQNEIMHYIDSCHPYDKAGSYGIQDWIGITKVSKIEGSYTNVMGLPTQSLYHVLLKQGLIQK